MIFTVSHRTDYEYGQPVAISHHVLHLAPRRMPNQHCHRHAVMVVPTPGISLSDRDYFGNPVTFMTIQEPHDQLEIHARSVMEVTAPPRPDPKTHVVPWDAVYARMAADTTSEGLERFQFAFDSPHTLAGPAVGEYARESFPVGRPLAEAAVELTSRIFHDFKFDDSATEVSTPVDEVFANRHGVCQDFAHLQIACLRSLGLSARYVSGYLMTKPPAGTEKLMGVDASHAWVSVWIPDFGWLDLDPTNDMIPGEEHVAFAWGRDYGDVSPVNGVILGGGAHTMKVGVDVIPAESLERAEAS
ncbi:MAG: transglutaminase [Rhodospirillaceae bacterium]|nr:transglutaminase [Rhodospirillaceae bacterium]